MPRQIQLLADGDDAPNRRAFQQIAPVAQDGCHNFSNRCHFSAAEFGFDVGMKQIALLFLLLSPYAHALPPSSPGREEASSLSFTNEPFIHPRVVESLISLVSDSGDQIVAVDLDGSQRSNLFSAAAPSNAPAMVGPGPYVFYDSKEEAEVEGEGRFHAFGYEFIGRTTSGVLVVWTVSCDGGSASWHKLLFACFETDYGLTVHAKEGVVRPERPRHLLRKLGEYFLGDRWKGMLKVEGNQVYIGNDHGWFSKKCDREKLVPRTNDWNAILTISAPTVPSGR